jgi:hypothetical protein
MYIPFVKRVTYSNDVLIERALPGVGEVVVAVGEEVEAFTELGGSKVSFDCVALGSNFALSKSRKVGCAVHKGDLIGRVGTKFVRAPFGGRIGLYNDGSFVLNSNEREYKLFSGVWGAVADVVEGKSVLLRTQTTDVHFVACTNGSVEGELVVFPNPSEVLQVQYLEKYAKSVFRKVVYVGDFAGVDLLKKAVTLGAVGVLAGSANRRGFVFAKQSGLFLGVFSGFGDLPTPKSLFDVLNNVSNRFVFVRGEENLLRIPMPEKFGISRKKSAGMVLQKVKKNLDVVVFDDEYFGWIGRVEKVLESSILVKLEKGDKTVEVNLPNVLALK